MTLPNIVLKRMEILYFGIQPFPTILIGDPSLTDGGEKIGITIEELFFNIVWTTDDSEQTTSFPT